MAVVLFTLPLLGAVSLGEVLAVGGIILQFLLAPKPKEPTFKAMTSAWGETIPIVYNSGRVAAKVIQQGPVQKHDNKSKKGGPSYSQTVALMFCEGQRQIGRIWADNQVIYDPRPLQNPPAWQASHIYGTGDIIQPTGGGAWQLTASINGESGPTEPAWNLDDDLITRDGDQVWIASRYVARTQVGTQYNFTIRIYSGDEIQLPDAALEELVGTGRQPGYRGLCYIVLEDFDLGRYGNRVPNLEAEILPQYSFQTYSTVGGEPWVDPTGSFVYLVGADLSFSNNVLYKFNLSTGTVAASATTSPVWQAFYEARGSFTGSFLAWAVWDGANNFILKINEADLSTIATYPWTPSGFAGDDILLYAPLFATSGDGSLCAGLFFDDIGIEQYLLIMDMTSGAYSWTKVSTISGAPASPTSNMLSAIAFDAAGFLWAADNHSKLWRTTVAAHAPTVMTSFTVRSDDGRIAYGLSYVPSSDDLIPWLDDAGGTFTAVGKFIRWGATSHTPTTAEFSWHYEATTLVHLTSLDLTGWSNRGIVATRDGFGNSVDILNTLTGVAANYPLSYWGTSGIGSFTRVAMGPNAATIFAQVNFNDEEAEAILKIASGMTLADICADVSGRIGLTGSDYDYTELAVVIPRGCTLFSRDAARAFLESLQPAFFYDLVDIGDKIVGKLRSNDTVLLEVPEADLGASDSATNITDRVTNQRNDDREIPQDISVQYYDIDHDYQSGSQQDRRSRITQYSDGRNTVNMPVVMNAGEANNAAHRSLYLTWVERVSRKFSLPPEYLGLTSSDVIAIINKGERFVVRISNVKLQPNWVIDVESVSEDLGTYTRQVPAPLTGMAVGAFTPGTINPIAPLVLAMLDTAALRTGDLQTPGIYAATAPNVLDGGYDGAFIQNSPDDSNFTTQASLTVAATMGTATTILAAPADWTVFDPVSTVTLTLLNGSLANAAKSALTDNGLVNALWFSNGEIAQFTTRVVNMDGTITASGLFRGRFGTEAFVSTHGSNETVVLLDATGGSMTTINYSNSDIGAERWWRALNDSTDNPTSDTQDLIMTTRRLMPRAPFFIKGSRSMGGDLTITGLRRMRWHGRALWVPPETDAPAAMQIDILNGVTVVRTITATASGGGSSITDPMTFSAVYTAADQTTDFGSPQASVSLNAYQMNTLVGRGYPGSKTV